jgi:hypothetical protein
MRHARRKQPPVKSAQRISPSLEDLHRSDLENAFGSALQSIALQNKPAALNPFCSSLSPQLHPKDAIKNATGKVF